MASGITVKSYANYAVFVNTDKKCGRCHGKGEAQFGSVYGTCFRCGGGCFEVTADIPATRRYFEETFARLSEEGKTAKERLALGGGVLEMGSARRALERARRDYKVALIAYQQFNKEHGL